MGAIRERFKLLAAYLIDHDFLSLYFFFYIFNTLNKKNNRVIETVDV
jgi:hypothetical protein